MENKNLQYNPTSGAFMQLKQGMNLGHPGFELIAEDQPSFKFNFFQDFLHQRNLERLNVEQVKIYWELFQYAFTAGESQETLTNFSDN